jgi:predicted transcriptional regulator with HTH domain
MKLSKIKKDKISEQILSHIFYSFPKQLFTAEIAREIARDEEFVKNLLLELKDKGIIILIRKNEKGKSFIRRQRWQLSSKAYSAYQNQIQQK